MDADLAPAPLVLTDACTTAVAARVVITTVRAPHLVVGAGPRFLVRANLARDRRAATCRWPAQHSSIGLKTKLRRPEVLNRAGRKEAQRRSAGVRGLARCGQLLDTARKHQRVDSGHWIPGRPVQHAASLFSRLNLGPVLVQGIATGSFKFQYHDLHSNVS